MYSKWTTTSISGIKTDFFLRLSYYYKKVPGSVRSSKSVTESLSWYSWWCDKTWAAEGKKVLLPFLSHCSCTVLIPSPEVPIRSHLCLGSMSLNQFTCEVDRDKRMRTIVRSILQILSWRKELDKGEWSPKRMRCSRLAQVEGCGVSHNETLCPSQDTSPW